jgi:hypothetical protein
VIIVKKGKTAVQKKRKTTSRVVKKVAEKMYIVARKK